MEKIKPFTSGSEAESWRNKNCHYCSMYENKSTEIEKARCKIAFSIDLAQISGGLIRKECYEKANIGKKEKCSILCFNYSRENIEDMISFCKQTDCDYKPCVYDEKECLACFVLFNKPPLELVCNEIKILKERCKGELG